VQYRSLIVGGNGRPRPRRRRRRAARRSSKDGPSCAVHFRWVDGVRLDATCVALATARQKGPRPRKLVWQTATARSGAESHGGVSRSRETLREDFLRIRQVLRAPAPLFPSAAGASARDSAATTAHTPLLPLTGRVLLCKCMAVTAAVRATRAARVPAYATGSRTPPTAAMARRAARATTTRPP